MKEEKENIEPEKEREFMYISLTDMLFGVWSGKRNRANPCFYYIKSKRFNEIKNLQKRTNYQTQYQHRSKSQKEAFDILDKISKNLDDQFDSLRQRKWDEFQRRREKDQPEWEKFQEEFRLMRSLNNKELEQCQEEGNKQKSTIQGSRIFGKIKVSENSDYDLLLVDDDIATVRLLRTYFESKNLTCKGVLNGAKALKELKKTTPKVVLLDILLPDISGYEICKKIKSDPKLKHIPVFFCTTLSGSEVERHLAETKADGYILYPISNFSDFDGILDLINLKSVKETHK